MCMWFGYNPCFNFCHFFHFVNFFIFWPQILWKCIDSGCLVSTTLHTILYRSFWNLTHVFCMWFGYNPWINFCHHFHFVNFVIFWPQILWKCIDSGYLVSAAPYTISYLSLCNFALLFSKVWRCACGLDLILQFIFVTFPLCCHFSIYRGCDISFTEVRSIFDRIFIKLAGNQDRHKILDEFEFRPDGISHLGVTCPWGRFKFSIDLLWNLQVQLTFQMNMYWVPCGRNSSYKFSTDCFETFQMFSAWNEDVHVLWI